MTPLERLEEAAGAAADLGLVDQARSAGALADRIRQRLGFSGELYVVAMVGGTGVGKSSVLNAIAGEEVSPARALRPTTEHPLAWVANEAREEIRPLLDWLGVERVVGHDRAELTGVAILDLPDVDSVRLEHRATVDALLPRIDAVAWVVDPEKYDDERLHEYLRRLAPHAERMRFVFNKADRLDPNQRQMLIDDFRRRLAGDGIDRATIDMVSALDGSGFEELRAELNRAAEGKAIVAAKLATDATIEVDAIARGGGAGARQLAQPVAPDQGKRDGDCCRGRGGYGTGRPGRGFPPDGRGGVVSSPTPGWLAAGPDPHPLVVRHRAEAASGRPWRLSARVATAGEPGPCPQPGSLGPCEGGWGGSARHPARGPDGAWSGLCRDRGGQGPRPRRRVRPPAN